VGRSQIEWEIGSNIGSDLL